MPQGDGDGSGSLVLGKQDSVKGGEKACCLAFSLRDGGFALESELKAFHRELQSCAELFGASIMELGATNGVLRCDVAPNSAVSAADTAIRLGQLLCRWTLDRDSPLPLRVGVHCGSLQQFPLPNHPIPGFFGSAVSRARRLSETAPDHWVHFMSATKERLSLFEGLPLTCSASKGSYYLEPWVEAANDPGNAKPGDFCYQGDQMARRTSLADVQVQSLLEDNGKRKALLSSKTMSFDKAGSSLEEFTKMLEGRGVDVSKFGKGHAKSVADFHKEIVVDRKAYLIDSGEKLERCLELVRINLCACDTKGQDRTLMVAMEIMEDGRTRQRNQKLATAVAQGSSWEEAVQRSFIDRFQISEPLQKELFALEMNWYKEEPSVSPSVPGIITKYLTHEVRMRVKDPTRPELQTLGLPLMNLFSTTLEDGTRKMSWAWVGKGEESTKEDTLINLLGEHGINVSEFDPGALAQLLDEYEKKTSVLIVKNNEIVRNLQIVKIWVSVDILSVPHVLVIKLKSARNKQDTSQKDRPISMRMKSNQTWEEAVRQGLRNRLGLADDFLARNTFIDPGTYRLREEVEYSPSYPGLKTIYVIHEVTCRLREDHPLLGLPDGLDFAFSRVEASMKSGGDGDVVTTYFSWKQPKELHGGVGFRRSLLDGTRTLKEEEMVDPKRRLVAPKAMTIPPKKDGELTVAQMMSGKVTDWDRARNAARRIRDPGYHCGLFLEDCMASFPELALYVTASADGTATTTSGRSPDDEFQRTMGAMFAVYWLMRIDIDGAHAFSFGVSDDDWHALNAAAAKPVRSQGELSKRSSFLEAADWNLFQEVLVSAGMLTADREHHDEERVLGMLVLTAIHDIMKVQCIVPRVAVAHKEFCGYRSGEELGDHDIALGYVLEHFPKALPSYAGLPAKQRESIKFTQSKMEYNMGWLVQAEAPPGALFRTFKAAITSGKAKQEDVAFYFTHWLTDLAGAEPCPQEGCEKFVLKFPHKVLGAFLHSFPYVQHLSAKTETEVFEDYLAWRWSVADPELGSPPEGPGSVARMRTVIMAQSAPVSFVRAYEELSAADREVIETELARTGCKHQAYRRDTLANHLPQAGPAFLVYYGPALFQKNAEDPVGALQVLAEVLRQARLLWPLRALDGDETVTVRIDALKELSCTAMQQSKPGEFWALQRMSGKDAQVVRLRMVGSDGLPTRVDWESHKLLGIGAQADLPAAPSATSALTGFPPPSRPSSQGFSEAPVAGLAPFTRLKAPKVEDLPRDDRACCQLWCGSK